MLISILFDSQDHQQGEDMEEEEKGQGACSSESPCASL